MFSTSLIVLLCGIYAVILKHLMINNLLDCMFITSGCL